MKQPFFIVIINFFLCLLFVACNNGGNPPTPTTTHINAAKTNETDSVEAADPESSCDKSQIGIHDYYDTHFKEEREQQPYSYIMHKYLNLFIDYLSQQELIFDTPFPVSNSCEENEIANLLQQLPYSLELTDKIEFTSLLTNEWNSEFEHEGAGATEIDEYCLNLLDSFTLEINNMPQIQQSIADAVEFASQNNTEIDSDLLYSDNILEFGGKIYHKLDILACFEYYGNLPQYSFLLSEEETNDPPCNICTEHIIYANEKAPHRLAQYKARMLWPHNRIKYRDHQCPNINEMESAMNTWTSASGNAIIFEEIQENGWNRFLWNFGLSYHVRLDETSNADIGGNATIGYVPWSTLRINGSQSSRHTYLHELGHILGLYHEMQRCDRDNYVRINYENIQKGYRYAFHKYSEIIVQPYGEFDFESIMMYPDDAFGIDNATTIESIDGKEWYSNQELSERDIQYIKYLYN